MLVKYSDRTIIGTRGFTDEEKEKGLILVFNNRNHRNLQWTEDGNIVAALSFGVSNRVENCFLHHEDIVAVFSPDAKVKFDRWDMWDVKEFPEASDKLTEPEKEKSDKEKIISFDNFKKTKT
jgi:hypothetical protein